MSQVPHMPTAHTHLFKTVIDSHAAQTVPELKRLGCKIVRKQGFSQLSDVTDVQDRPTLR
jgi:hypothetical protein